MEKYKNTAETRRVWPTIQRPDGTTLELDPGEVVNLDLPGKLNDPVLAVVGKPKGTRSKAKPKVPKTPPIEKDREVAAPAGADTDATDKETQS